MISFIKNKWLDFIEFTDNIPEEASARKLEPKLTEEQLKRRNELVKAIHLAASLQDRNIAQTQTEKIDDRLTVRLLYKEKYLIEPELLHYSNTRGAIYTAKRDSGRMRIIFSGGIGTQAYAKRKEIMEGMQVRRQSWIASTAMVELREEEEEFTVVERARKRGYHMSIVITLTLLTLLSSLQVVS